MNRRIAFAVLAAVGAAASAADQPLLEESRSLTEEFGGRLSAELKAAIEAGGPTAAIDVCKSVAPQIASDLSRTSGAKIGRTSLRIRNPANAPEPWQVEVLRRFDEQAAAGDAEDPLEYFEPDSAGGARYMKAIRMAPLCVVCHGPELPDDVRASLDNNYAYDQAVGYGIGDVRGAFTVTWTATQGYREP